MSTLAIKGHLTRGKEVIQTLEMLGGIKEKNFGGSELCCWYYINENGKIDYRHYSLFNDTKAFTLEEFLEKFPYKVGDKVIYKSEVFPIIGMKWDCCRNIVIYTMKTNCGIIDCYDSTWMKPYKEETPTEIKVDIPKGYEFAGVDDDKQQVVFTKKQSQYLKTYEECCKIMGIEYPVVGGEPGGLSASTYRINEIRPFIYLLICRDAYWKIAGNQMGLGKSWRPSKNDDVYCIFRLEGEIVKDNFVFADSLILEFPTEEMRDAFYENFKDLIEECKELL